MLELFSSNPIITILSASPFIIVTFFNCISSASSIQLLDVCGTFNCGQGTCKASNSTIVGFECDCNPGWRSIQVGPFTWPSCVLPNCSLDFKCGSLAPTLPPPPAPVLPLPTPDLLSPCGLVWCGDGNCLSNGTGYTCNCYEGAVNLLNLQGLPCFRPCFLGSDCIGLGFDDPPKPSLLPQSPPPPPATHQPRHPPPPATHQPLQPPLPPSSTSDNNSSQTSSCSSSILGFTRITLALVVLAAAL